MKPHWGHTKMWKGRRPQGNLIPHRPTSIPATTLIRETCLQELQFPPDHICLFTTSAKAEASNPVLLQGFGTFMFFGLFLASVREWRCVVKMTMSLWKSDSEKRNSAFSAKARRPLIHTIKQRAKERKKRHRSAQRLPASVNSNLGCCWWLAVCQTLTEFQNGNNQAVMSVSPWGTDIFANLLSTHLAIGCSMEYSWILEKATETEFEAIWKLN